MEENELMDALSNMIIPGINVKSESGDFRYYADIALDELKRLELIKDGDSVFQFDYEITAYEEYENLYGYHIKIFVRGKDLIYNNNCIFDEIYTLNYFNLNTILSDLEGQNLIELSKVLYERIESKSYINRPKPRVISASDGEWEQIESLAQGEGLTASEFILKKCLPKA